MDTFAERAIGDYPLLFADQGKQTFLFPFSFAANKWNFTVSIFRLRNSRNMEILTWRHGEMEMDTYGIMETWKHG